RPLSRAERQDFLRSGFSVAQYRRDNRLRLMRTTNRAELLERIWARPTFEVHGLVGGYSGPGLKSIVPGRAEVKVSCRLVPDQRPERISRLVRARVRRLNPDVKVVAEGGALPFRG